MGDGTKGKEGENKPVKDGNVVVSVVEVIRKETVSMREQVVDSLVGRGEEWCGRRMREQGENRSLIPDSEKR